MIQLQNRTEEHVKIYFERTRDAQIRAMLPSSAQTLEDALMMYRKSQEPDSTSYGQTIYYDGHYVGDIWCYGLGDDEPDAMLSYCIFERKLWGRHIATQAIHAFLSQIAERFGVKTIGAFTYCDNMASIKVLLANGFSMIEEFTEDGRKSAYYEKNLSK